MLAFLLAEAVSRVGTDSTGAHTQPGDRHRRSVSGSLVLTDGIAFRSTPRSRHLYLVSCEPCTPGPQTGPAQVALNHGPDGRPAGILLRGPPKSSPLLVPFPPDRIPLY
ncbi:hypothetical protein SKAU_G00375470 [Synaphobranchus kaupii]|uniref:Uncharacterized protein n=1 Tax=Synaphobranchus kaupii TaxID=118154 RepID=A0A9Q1IGD4_SYNKA|nr:hypothetical protein SKAU_G00375470 [Synaphobranchus kaupii]